MTKVQKGVESCRLLAAKRTAGIGAIEPLSRVEPNAYCCPTPAIRCGRRERLSWVDTVEKLARSAAGGNI